MKRSPAEPPARRHHAVSSRHCVIRRDAAGTFWIRDDGSTNGTWVEGRLTQGVIELKPGVRFIVGAFTLKLQSTGPRAPAPKPRAPAGPLLRLSADRAREARPRGRASQRSDAGRAWVLAACVLVVGLAGAALAAWPSSEQEGDVGIRASTSSGSAVPGPPDPVPVGDDTSPRWIEHTVIPAETLEEIARRYEVPIRSLERWNGVDESQPLSPGMTLRLWTTARPLPWQRIRHRPDGPESWSSLAQRFDVPVAKLQAYNPKLVNAPIDERVELTVYVDPRPPKRKSGVRVPEFTVRPDAVSVGSPRAGEIETAIQFPPNDKLYKRRRPQVMWCSSYTAAKLILTTRRRVSMTTDYSPTPVITRNGHSLISRVN